MICVGRISMPYRLEGTLIPSCQGPDGVSCGLGDDSGHVMTRCCSMARARNGHPTSITRCHPFPRCPSGSCTVEVPLIEVHPKRLNRVTCAVFGHSGGTGAGHTPFVVTASLEKT